jgi:hypothetical protein
MTAVLSLLSCVYLPAAISFLNTWLSQRVGFFPPPKIGGYNKYIYVSLCYPRKIFTPPMSSGEIYFSNPFQSKKYFLPLFFYFLKEKMIMYTKWPFCRVVYVVSCRITLSYLFPQKKGDFWRFFWWCFNLFFSVSNIFFLWNMIFQFTLLSATPAPAIALAAAPPPPVGDVFKRPWLRKRVSHANAMESPAHVRRIMISFFLSFFLSYFSFVTSLRSFMYFPLTPL